ncbi:hypothetical protein HJC23_010775 [Cyclotella cryptica]|uniref:Uncharacterized protein n=1 Tax=Cyclotella cryptica TaxID=29204 RepID=A0ABD3PV75_9STRA
MKTSDLHEARLIQLQFNKDDPPVEELNVFKGEEVLRENSGPMVRGDARILLSKVAKDDTNKDETSPQLHGFRLLAIVKETGVDDEGLREFRNDYFPYPTYKDQERVFYTALGSGKISLGFNPLGIIKMIQDSFKRIKELGVKSYNMKGEGLIQGGWIIFDKSGVPQAAFQENAKERIPIDDILAELKKIEDQAK